MWLRRHGPSQSAPRLVLVSGTGFVATPPAISALEPRICMIPDARWATRGQAGAVDCYDRPSVAIASLGARGHAGAVRLTTLTLRCTALSAFDDRDLAFFNCSLEDFESRASAASQEVMEWVRQRWGLDGVVTRALHHPGAMNLAVVGHPGTRVARVTKHQLITVSTGHG